MVVAVAGAAAAGAEEADAATSHNDFIAKNRIALREAKETRFRLRVCRRTGLLTEAHDALIDESDQLVRILGKIVHTAIKRRAARLAARKQNNRYTRSS